MKTLILIWVLIILCISALWSQCPEGPAPSFWHPDQVDSFTAIYPNCEDYTWSFYMVGGEVVKKPETNNPQYLLVLFGFYTVILSILKVITIKVKYFK